MNDDDDFLADAFRRMLAGLVTPTVIRAIESGGTGADLWASFEESGFVDAMLPESDGGAGIGLAQAFPLLLAAGEYCVPVPFAETMIARGLLAEQGVSPPSGAAIALAPSSVVVPGGQLAGYALVNRSGVPTLVTASPTGDDLFRVRCSTGIEEGDVIATLSPDAEGLLLAAAAVAGPGPGPGAVAEGAVVAAVEGEAEVGAVGEEEAAVALAAETMSSFNSPMLANNVRPGSAEAPPELSRRRAERWNRSGGPV